MSKTQKDWDFKLAHVELAYSRSPAFAIGPYPFEIVYGVNS